MKTKHFGILQVGRVGSMMALVMGALLDPLGGTGFAQVEATGHPWAITNYSYTNGNVWVCAAGTVTLAGGTNSPVPVTQGKRMGLLAKAVASDLTSSNVTATAEFSVDKTNWVTTPTANLVFALNGASTVNVATNWDTVVSDNFQWVRVKSVSSTATSSYYFTNFWFITH